MRIFVAVRHSADPRFYYGGLWSGNFYPALRQLGHEIVESNVDLLPLSRFMHVPGNFTREELQARTEITERLLDEVRAAQRERPLNLFLSYFYNAHFDPAGFDQLRKLGIRSVNFYCNSIYQFENVAEVARRADFSWHPEKHARDLYLKAGANPVWVQMGADPKVYHPIPEIPRQPSACFVGQRYADRDRWMAALIQSGIPVAIYGPGWGSDGGDKSDRTKQPSKYLGRLQPAPGSSASYLRALRQVVCENGLVAGVTRVVRQIRYRNETRRLSPLFAPSAQGSIPFEKIADVFAAHEVCLNFSNVWLDGRPGSDLIAHVRLRDFEAPMCRTCYLTGYTDEIGEFYEVGKEIDTYGSHEELIDKVRYYLGHHAAAERLRAAGYARARRDHTWANRFSELFSKL